MSRGSRAKPTVGDRILVHDVWTDQEVKGLVSLLMSEQFSWIDEMGDTFITRYDGEWRIDAQLPA